MVIFFFLIIGLTGCGGGQSNNSEPTTLLQISITASTQDLPLGTTATLQATGHYSDNSTQDLTSQVVWSSTNSAIVSIDNNGLLTSQSIGNTTIVASFGGIDAQTPITISSPLLTTLEITPIQLTLALGTTSQLSATGIYTDNSSQNLTSQVVWSSDNNAVISVNNSGQLTSQGSGTATVSANLNGVAAQASITVTTPTLASLTIISGTSSIPLGTSVQLTAHGTFTDGSTQDLTQQATWSSTDNNVATTQSGLVTSVTTGSINISANFGTTSATTPLSITPAILQRIEVNPNSVNLALGNATQLYATGIYSDNSNHDLTKQVNWASGNEAISTISNSSDKAGWLNSFSAGSTIATASLDGVSGTASISISDAVLVAIEVSPINSSIPAGLNRPFHATGIFSDNSTQDLTSLATWTSSEINIALINNTASERGVAYGLDTGNSTITAHYGNQSGSANLNITPASLTSITLSPVDANIALGTSQQFTAIGQYSDGSSKELTDQVQWESSSPSIVSPALLAGKFISQSVTATAVKISASLNGVSAFTDLTVSSATLQSISISPSNSTIAKGHQQLYSATGYYSDSSHQDITSQVTWSSSDDNLAPISNHDSNKGMVDGQDAVTATISATYEGVSNSATLTVTDAILTGITLQTSSNQLTVGSTLQLDVIGSFSDSSTQLVTTLATWSSSDSTVANVSNADDGKGLVDGLAIGSIVISAAIGGFSDSLNLTITEDPDAPKSLSISASPNVILNDDSDRAHVTITLQPNSASGVIADGTAVDVTINEGASSNLYTLYTTDGRIRFNLSSNYQGSITIQAEAAAGVSNTTTLHSVTDFADALYVVGFMNPLYSSGTFLAGSQLGLYMKNLSNRTFEVGGFEILNGGVQALLITDPAALSDGYLEGGESTGIIISLATDTPDNVITSHYILRDTTSGSYFGFGATYTP